MPTTLSISEIISIGRASTYLSANYAEKKKMFGGSVMRPTPPIQIAWVTDALDWGNTGGAQTDESLRSTANYAYWLYGYFGLLAQNIIYGPGGGSVVPTPSGGAVANPLDFIVSATSIIATGETSILFDGTSGNPDFRGYDVNFARGAAVQYTTPDPDGALYYSWNKVTGQFQLLTLSVDYTAAAQAGERFRIMPDLGSGSSSSVTSESNTVTVNAAAWTDAVTLDLPFIVGHEIMMLIVGYIQDPVFAPESFTYTATGIVVIIPGFDSANFSKYVITRIN